MQMGYSSRKAASLCLFLPITFIILFNTEAFPFLQHAITTINSHNIRTKQTCAPLLSAFRLIGSKKCPPPTSKRREWVLGLSMVARDNSRNSDSESNAENDDGDNMRGSPSSQSQESERDIDEFDANDWEPMDFDDVDDFFNSMEFPGYDEDGDYYEETDDPEELLKVLQEMIDNSDRTGFRDLRNNKVTSGDEADFKEIDEETLLEILGIDEEEDATPVLPNGNKESDQFSEWDRYVSNQGKVNKGIGKGIEDLEKVLLGGVVPAEAGVGSGMLPGDNGFDPLELATKDYFKQVQNFLLKLIPERKDSVLDETKPEAGAAMPTIGFVGEEERPPALILRDYREAEIRHGRLAMLAAVIWPIQEILDRIFIPESFGSMTVIYGGPTLPFFPLAMTFFMLNLGYLDIYSSEIKENESGDAFLPGECFWDPLAVMQDAPDLMKRNMQEREILNGRAAMIAVAAFIFEEAASHRPIITIPGNALLFEPFYQEPSIQAWLDMQFGSIG